MQIDLSLAGLPAHNDEAAPLPAALRSKVEKSAEQFEAMFVRQMLAEMRKTTRLLGDEDSLFRSRQETDMLDFADGMLADQLAGQRAFGIANAILHQLLPPPAKALEPPAD